MANSLTFRRSTPSNERYVHFLMWLSPFIGGIRSYLFSHTDGSETRMFKNFMVETRSDIRSVPEEVRGKLILVATNMDIDTYDYVRTILESNRIFKVLRDGTQIPFAIKSAEIDEPNKNKGFSIKIELVPKEENVLNV